MNSFNKLKPKLIDVQSRGYVKTLRKGDTGVGYTLETLLGIKENNDSGPDFHDIEIKGKRSGRNSKISTFTLVPIWLKDRMEVFSSYGKWNEEKKRYNFFPSLSCGSVNPKGLTLKTDNENVYIFCENTQTALAEWSFGALAFHQKRKLRKLILGEADIRGRGKNEEFHYHTFHYYESPTPGAFKRLLEEGKLVLEPRAWFDPHKGKSGFVKDRGPAFRITASLLDELYDHKEKIL